MNREFTRGEGRHLPFVAKLIAIGLALCICQGVNAQNVVVPPKPVQVADLVISSLSAKLIASNRVQYSWTITNVGTAPANLEGPTASSTDNVKVQAFLSKDTVFGNAGDIPAGGTIVGTSPLGNLAPQASRSGSFTATFQGNVTQMPHLVLKVDSGNAVTELNENNNTAAVGIAR
jgi:CARDB